MPCCIGDLVIFFFNFTLKEAFLDIPWDGLTWLAPAPSPPSLLSVAFHSKSSEQARLWQWESQPGWLQKEADVRQTFESIEKPLRIQSGKLWVGSVANTAATL